MSGNFSDIHKNAYIHERRVYCSVYDAFVRVHENTYVSAQRELRLYNSNSQIENIVWRLTLPNDISEIPLEGMVHLQVTYQSETIQNFPFYVTRSGSSLMGLDFFDQLGFKISKNGVIIQSVDIVSTFPSVFTGFGKIARFVHRRRVNPEVTPVSQGLCRLPFSVREDVSRELKRLQDDGMIEPIDSSPWISNLVVARRKSGEIRLCVDLKAVNKA